MTQLTWRKSSRCGNTTCLEVANTGKRILVRDSKNPNGWHLTFDRQPWAEFIAGIRAGDFSRD